MSKKLSVAVCTHNNESGLKNTIESLLKQTFKNMDIIIIDNASTDGTKKLVAKYAVRYVFEKNAGLSFARNAALEAVESEYIAFIDDDETLVSEWAEKIVAAMELDDLVGMAGGPMVPVYEKEPPSWMPTYFFAWDEPVAKLVVSKPYYISRTFPGGNATFRISAIGNDRYRVDLGRKGKSLLSGEDSEFIERMYAKGHKALYVPQAIVWHHTPASRTSMNWLNRRLFAEGRTELLTHGYKIIWRRWYRPLLNVLALMLSFLTFDKKKIVKRWLKLVQSCGVVFGWISK